MSSAVAIFLLVFSCITFGYLFGSIMASDIVGFFIKKSAREHISKNPGTTNSIRVYGKKSGIIVGFFDIFKGFITFVICWAIYQYGLQAHVDPAIQHHIYYVVYLTNLFVIIGHCWPIFFKFKGGKAAAPTVGFLLSVSYWWFLIILIVWITVLCVYKYVSLATLVCAFLLPVINLINYLDLLMFFKGGNPLNHLTYDKDWDAILFLEIVNVLFAAIIFVRHKANIKRLLNHNENRIGSKK